MLLEILVAAGRSDAYRQHFAKRAKTRSTASRSKRRSDATACGRRGYRTTQAKTLYRLCGYDFYLQESPLFIKHAPRTDFSTADNDHLALTPSGVSIFETKGWSGHIAPSEASGRLTRTAPNGQRSDRLSPIDNNRSEVGFLRDHLPPVWPVAGLFTLEEVL
jgi:hypothetical protein